MELINKKISKYHDKIRTRTLTDIVALYMQMS